MCRMLGIVPEQHAVVDFEIVRSFRNLASCGRVISGSAPGHVDGWGIVAWQNGLPFYFGRQPTDAFTDPKFDEACDSGSSARVSSPLIAHLRKSSSGQKTEENTHPFVFSEWAFAHNGTIRGLNLKADTDSEWFFRSLMDEFGKSKDILKAISRQIRSVKDIYRPTSMTFLLSNGRQLFAYRDYRRHEDYYTMYYTKSKYSTVVAQEKFFESNWRELPNGGMLVVERDQNPKIIDLLK